MTDPQPEICVCAAIIADDGTIFRGHRHDDCIQAAIKHGKKAGRGMTTDWQGFMTTRNRYVDRLEAMRLQRAAGAQSAYSPDGELRGDMLFSEDLY